MAEKRKDCEFCGKSFVYERSTAKFCSTNCRARGHKNERPRIPDDLRWHVLYRDEFRCRMCGHHPNAKRELRVDHMVPVAKGGPLGDPDNLLTMCQQCNSGKSTRTITWDMVPPLDAD